MEINSSPDHVCRLSYTIVAKSSRVSAVIPLGHAESLGLVLAHAEVRRILQEPTLDNSNKTFITDQAKGLVESVNKVLPAAGHFHCSYHRRKNIEKYCKGGKKAYSGS